MRETAVDAPVERKARSGDRSHRGGVAAPVKERRLSPWLRKGLVLLLPFALIGGAVVYVRGGATVSTDDAYVEADKVGISTDVPGIVNEVDVTENQHVTAGQILYRLDPMQFQIALQNAQANLGQIGLMLESMKQDYRRMLSDAAAQQAQADLDQINYNRNAALLPTSAVSKAAYDQTQFTLRADRSKLDSLHQLAQVQLAKLDGDPDKPTAQLPQYIQAAAQVAEAQRQLDHTVVRAPFAGVVTNVPSIAPGKYLAASMTAFFLVDTDHVWVDAQPKETQLTWVRPGQPATISVDSYPNVEWHGTVETISPAAAQEFSLLPAQNTSGNWVKVVQRVPMRLRVDTSDPKLPPLRAGMSVEADVDTGHARGLPHFITALFGGGGTS
jgi:membrane fusion protein (multidrug efflux system)